MVQNVVRESAAPQNIEQLLSHRETPNAELVLRSFPDSCAYGIDNCLVDFNDAPFEADIFSGQTKRFLALHAYICKRRNPAPIRRALQLSDIHLFCVAIE